MPSCPAHGAGPRCPRSTPGTAGSTPTATRTAPGLVAILHPWEAGRDNSIDWDEPFARVPTEGVAPYPRRDTQHANPADRPTQGAVRPLHLAGRATSARSAGTTRSCTTPRPSRWSIPASTPSSSAPTRRSPRLAEAIGLAEIAAAAPRPRRAGARRLPVACGARRPASTCCCDRVAGKLDRQPLGRRPPAGLRRPRRHRAADRRPSGAGGSTPPSASPRTIPPTRASSRGATGAARRGWSSTT